MLFVSRPTVSRTFTANCELFLKNFVDDYADSGQPKYAKILVGPCSRACTQSV